MRGFDVDAKRLAGVVSRFLDVLALRVQSGEIGSVDVKTALVLRLEYELELMVLGHAVKIPPTDSKPPARSPSA
jgi:hypothetical protein